MSARIAFFGLPLAAVLLAGDGHEIVYAGACRRALGLRRLATRIAPGRTFVRPDVASTADPGARASGAPDLLVSWFWTTRLPEPLLRLAPVGRGAPVAPASPSRPGSVLLGHRLGRRGDRRHRASPRRSNTTPATSSRSASSPSTRPGTRWLLARALDRPSLALLREVVRASRRGAPAAAPIPQDEAARHGGAVAGGRRPGDRVVVARRTHRAARAGRGAVAGRLDGDRRAPGHARARARDRRLPARARAGRGGRRDRRRGRRPRRRPGASKLLEGARTRTTSRSTPGRWPTSCALRAPAADRAFPLRGALGYGSIHR